MNERVSVACSACGLAAEVPAPVSPRELCPSCGAELRCCRSCRFYDTRAYNECREASAERVVEKDRRNLCDYFSPGADAGVSVRGGSPAKDTLEGLFKKK
jgi:hypothetical protein